MMTAKIFENGESQAVRLPQKCRFQTSEVAVNKICDIDNAYSQNKQMGAFFAGSRYVFG